MTDFPYARVVVTGGAGFLGRHVVAALQARNVAAVIVPRRRDYDLVEKADVVRLLEESRPDLVIHLAALVGGIGFNQQQPARLLYDNLMMGTQLVEQARRIGVRKLVAVGTVCAYPKYAPVPFREESLWDGYPEVTNAPYGLAKKMLLAQLQAYRTQYGFPGIYLLPTNLFGPGDTSDPERSHVIPALIVKCLEARRVGSPYIEVWGTGTASRDFLYVADAAEGIVQAAALYDGGEPVNLGSGQEVLIRDLVARIIALTGYRGEVRWRTDQPDGQVRRRLCTDRARARFGFHATTSLDEGLLRTVAWFERHAEESPSGSRRLPGTILPEWENQP